MIFATATITIHGTRFALTFFWRSIEFFWAFLSACPKEIQIEGDAQFPRVDNERIAIACDELLKECLRRRSSDNMSVVVVVLQ